MNLRQLVGALAASTFLHFIKTPIFLKGMKNNVLT